MVFGQITNRESLRDLIDILETHYKNPTILDLVTALPEVISQKQIHYLEHNPNDNQSNADNFQGGNASF